MRTLADRLWEKVDRSCGANACWPFTGSLTRGYGKLGIGHRHEGTALAHRLAYELLIGPIPAGHELDHTCRNTACCNPAHLEPVTGEENLRRQAVAQPLGTHCRRGHAFTSDNTARRGRRQQRVCRTCERIGYARRNADPKPRTARQLARAERLRRYEELRRSGVTQAAAGAAVGVTQACGSLWEQKSLVTLSANLRAEAAVTGVRT